MDKEEILKKAQKENNGKDFADLEAQKKGAWVAYMVGVLLIIAVDCVNGFVLHFVNRGADFALFTMAFAAFLVKYIKLRKKHELIVTICWGVLSVPVHHHTAEINASNGVCSRGVDNMPHIGQ